MIKLFRPLLIIICFSFCLTSIPVYAELTGGLKLTSEMTYLNPRGFLHSLLTNSLISKNSNPTNTSAWVKGTVHNKIKEFHASRSTFKIDQYKTNTVHIRSKDDLLKLKKTITINGVTGHSLYVLESNTNYIIHSDLNFTSNEMFVAHNQSNINVVVNGTVSKTHEKAKYNGEVKMFDCPIILIDRSEKISIKGGSPKSALIGQNSACGIKLQSANNIDIRNLYVSEMYRGIHLAYNNKQVNVVNNVLDCISNHGLWITLSSNVNVSSNMFGGMGCKAKAHFKNNDAIELDGNSHNVIVKNNIIVNFKRYAIVNLSGAHNNTVENNFITTFGDQSKLSFRAGIIHDAGTCLGAKNESHGRELIPYAATKQFNIKHNKIIVSRNEYDDAMSSNNQLLKNKFSLGFYPRNCSKGGTQQKESIAPPAVANNFLFY